MPLGTDPVGRAIGGVPKVSSAVQSDPRSQVSSYVNQQLGGLISGTSPTVGPSQRSNYDSTSNPFGEDDKFSLSPVSRIHQQSALKLKESNDRIAVYQQAALKKRQLGATAGRQYDMGQGVTWQTNGSLSASRNRALSLASSYIGKTPYVFGGTSAKGLDCSGLIMAVYSQLGYSIPQHSAGWQGRNIPGVRTSIANLQPGDIVAWKDGSHIAIYAGNGQIIEAAKPGTLVRTHSLWSNAVYGIHLQLPGE